MHRFVWVCWLLSWLAVWPRPANGQFSTALDSSRIWPTRIYIPVEGAPFPVHHVRARNISRTGSIDMEIEIYNLLVPAAVANRLAAPARADATVFQPGDTLLICFSVLPKPDKRRYDWVPINRDTIPVSRLLSFAQLVHDGAQRISAAQRPDSPKEHTIATRLNLLPLVRREGRELVPGATAQVQTQFFLVRPRRTKYLDQIDYVTLNVLSPVLDEQAPWPQARALLTPQRYAAPDYQLERTFRYPSLRGIVAGARRPLGITQFWSHPVVLANEGWPITGVGVFNYKPGIGILDGEYQMSYINWQFCDFKVFFNSLLIDDKRLIIKTLKTTEYISDSTPPAASPPASGPGRRRSSAPARRGRRR